MEVKKKNPKKPGGDTNAAQKIAEMSTTSASHTKKEEAFRRRERRKTVPMNAGEAEWSGAGLRLPAAFAPEFISDHPSWRGN